MTLRQDSALRLGASIEALRRWPWLDTLRVLRQRFREDRLGLTAGSLTFTTLIALVPLVTVMLAVFSAFPMFSSFQVALEKYFLQNLVPDGIAKPVLRELTRFATKANQLGAAGLVILGATALALMLTIDRTLNAIWRVRKPRSIAQRVLVYWAALTLGPLALGMSLSMTSYALSASRGLVGVLPSTVASVLNVVEFLLLMTAVAGLFHYVPNTAVRWRHAWAGALFVAAAFELAKKGLGWYVSSMPAYATVYGVFATVPILLLWVYLSWVIMLLGAVIAAYAPSLQMRITLRPDTPGQRFETALVVLRRLEAARHTAGHGLSLPDLAAALHSDPLALEPLLDLLVELDWAARLDEAGTPRHVLLCDPALTAAQPLVDALLLAPGEGTRAFRQHARIGTMTLAEVLG
ncbi:YihY family inner membrane protein [Rubrivivax sp. RP6-9]|uniref:YihY family inner membrane protein n=1 Tax=Rubrivivax sp. RP6-9 TaxID=3415750 RepID=UPI003CC63CB7